MNVGLYRHGLYVRFRDATDESRALGFVIKARSEMLFTARHGYYRRAFTLGPLYFRTYALRAA